MQLDHYLLHLSKPNQVHHIVWYDGAGPNLVEGLPTDLEALLLALSPVTHETDINMAQYNQVGSLATHCP